MHCCGHFCNTSSMPMRRSKLMGWPGKGFRNSSSHLRRDTDHDNDDVRSQITASASSTYLLVFVVQCDHSASCCVDAQSSDTLIHTSGSVRHRILHSLAQASPPIKRVLLSMAKTREVRLVLVSTRRQWCMKTRLLEHSRSRNRCQSHISSSSFSSSSSLIIIIIMGIWSSYCRVMIRWFKLGWITPWQQSISRNGIFIFTSVDRCNFCFCLT